MSSDPSPTPVKPLHPRVRVEEIADDLVLRNRPQSFGGACFLLFFLVGWSSGCVMLVFEVLKAPSIQMVVFAIPFVAAWFALVFFLMVALFGREELRLSRDGLSYDYRALVGLSRRKMPLAEVKRFNEGWSPSSGDTASYCVRVETLGKPLDFASGVSQKELRWLLDVLNRHFDALRGKNDRSSAAAPDETTPPEQLLDDPTQPEILRRADRPVEPPSDCEFVVEREFDRTQFIARGRWSLGAIIATTLINCFWNGIVGVFICQLFHQFDWLLFFFLFPFEALGLVFVLVWLAALLGPAWHLSWTLERHEITRRMGLLAICFTRRYAVLSLDHIELHRASLDPKKSSTSSVPTGPKTGGAYSLSFVTRQGEELFEISQLTEGEARWLADGVYRDFAQWFPRESQR